MVKLGRTSEIEIDELLRKNAEEMKKLSDKVDEATNSKKKMETLLAEVERKKAEKEDLLAEVEKKKAEKEEKTKQEVDSHDGHDHKNGHSHVHTLSFTEKGIGKCTGKDCLTEFSLGPVIGEDDWDKEMPDPTKYAESGFDEKKVHNVFECTTCGNKVVGPKRKDVGVENKLSDCPFCKNPQTKFQPVDLRRLKGVLNRK